jgi:hypothetical protein
MDDNNLSDGWRPPLYHTKSQKRPPIQESEEEETLSLLGLEPGTEEYKRIEALLIERICDVELD